MAARKTATKTAPKPKAVPKTEFDNSDRGALWANNFKFTETSPDYRGRQNVLCPHCTERFDLNLIAWDANSANPAAPVLNLRTSPPTQKKEQAHG